METREKILESVINESLSNFPLKISTIAVAKNAKTSEANIYRIFKTKNNLLTETFLYIDAQIGAYIKENSNDENCNNFEEVINYGKKVWLCYLDFFVKHKNYTVYYSLFRKSELYTDTVTKLQEENYMPLVRVMRFIDADLNIYESLPYNLFWSFILDTTLMIAIRMAEKEIEYNSNNIEYTFHLVFDGLINLVKGKNNIGE